MHLSEGKNKQSLIRSIWDNVMEILKGNFPWWQFQVSHLLSWHIDALEMRGSLHFKLTHLTLVPWVSLCSESCWKLRKAWDYFSFQLWVVSLSAQSWQSLWQFMPCGHQEQGSLSLWSVTRIIKAPAESFLFNFPLLQRHKSLPVSEPTKGGGSSHTGVSGDKPSNTSADCLLV